MPYKYSSGPQIIGDLKAQDDTQRDTIIDFGEDQIDFQTSGSTRMSVTNDGVQVSGLMIGEEYAFPSTDGTDGQVLQTDGNGNLSFASVGGGSSAEQQKLVDTNYSTGEQINRSFTYMRHYNVSIGANTWTDVVSWRPYITGGTNEPTHLHAVVSYRAEISGLQNGVANGYRSRKGFVSYEGASAANDFSSDITLGSGPISARIVRTGWVATLQVNADSSGAAGFRGSIFVEIQFARGGGTNGEQIYWDIT